MSESLDRFRANLDRISAVTGIAEYLSKSTTIDVSDLYRAIIVLAVSALDSFVHELVIEKLPRCATDSSRQTEAYLRFPIPLRWVELARSNPRDLSWIIGAIQESHSYLSFQHPDKVADAFRLVSDKQLWNEVAVRIGKDAQTVKQTLKLIVDRRNKIAHEADTNPVDRTLWPIDSVLVAEAIADLHGIVEAIDHVMS